MIKQVNIETKWLSDKLHENLSLNDYSANRWQQDKQKLKYYSNIFLFNDTVSSSKKLIIKLYSWV